MESSGDWGATREDDPCRRSELAACKVGLAPRCELALGQFRIGEIGEARYLRFGELGGTAGGKRHDQQDDYPSDHAPDYTAVQIWYSIGCRRTHVCL